MKELSKIQKISLLIAVLVCVLVFYVVGIVTNLFGSPVFSAFWVVSADSAHTVVIYVAISVSIILGVVGLAVIFFRKRKTMLPPAQNKPYAPILRLSGEPSIDDTVANTNQENVQKPKKVTYKSESRAKLSNPQLVKYETTDPQPVANENLISETQNEPKENEKMVCPSCKKEFNQPLFMMDYTGQEPKVVGYCPYCNQQVGERKA